MSPEDEIFIIVKPGILILKRIPTFDQLLSREPLASIDIEEFEKISENEQKKSASKVIT